MKQEVFKAHSDLEMKKTRCTDLTQQKSLFEKNCVDFTKTRKDLQAQIVQSRDERSNFVLETYNKNFGIGPYMDVRTPEA